jgi:hypothetical protein
MLALLVVVPAVLALATLGLADWQLWLVTMVLVPIVAEILRLVSANLGYKPTKFTMMVGLSVVSLVLASLFNLDLYKGLPPIADGFLAWFEGLVFVMGSLIGLAKIIYDIAWDRLFDYFAKKGLGILTYRVGPK